MRTFIVPVSQLAIAYTTYQIEAEDEDEALELALERWAEDNDYEIDWGVGKPEASIESFFDPEDSEYPRMKGE